MLPSFSFSLYSNSTIFDGQGMAMMPAKRQTRPSSRRSMWAWLRTTLTIWASKPSWRLLASRQQRPWWKARKEKKPKQKERKTKAKKSQAWKKSTSQMKRRKTRKLKTLSPYLDKWMFFILLGISVFYNYIYFVLIATYLIEYFDDVLIYICWSHHVLDIGSMYFVISISVLSNSAYLNF